MDDLTFQLNGAPVAVPDDGASLLEVLRDRLGVRSPKDGCSPQGQCGCCTVLVDGKARVACVTPARRIRGREITTVEGLPDEDAGQWARAFCATGGSQCGFCTPGILLRLEGLRRDGVEGGDRPAVQRALLPHLCRCTGWQTITEAYEQMAERPPTLRGRDLAAASQRATIEGRTPQRVAPDVVLGGGGFADDTAPPDALVAVRVADGTWAVGESLMEARGKAAKVQGRRTTMDLRHPIEFPPGDWDGRLRTTWVEPAYLETDAAWCEPGGEPASPLGNGGAFGGKVATDVAAEARRLADEHGRPVRVLWSREDTVRLGPKRPPFAGGVRRDGTGTMIVAATPGIEEAIARVAPRIEVQQVHVAGPPTSAALRAAGWAEAVALLASARHPEPVRGPEGSIAEASIRDGVVRIEVECGDPLDEVVLRSYCIGAAHMALSWVWSEGIAVDAGGEVHDLTIRSFGVLRPEDMPRVEVRIGDVSGPPVNGSDAVFAAVAAAATVAEGRPEHWPTRRRVASGA